MNVELLVLNTHGQQVSQDTCRIFLPLRGNSSSYTVQDVVAACPTRWRQMIEYASNHLEYVGGYVHSTSKAVDSRDISRNRVQLVLKNVSEQMGLDLLWIKQGIEARKESWQLRWNTFFMYLF